jgi:hypothetical protein
MVTKKSTKKMAISAKTGRIVSPAKLKTDPGGTVNLTVPIHKPKPKPAAKPKKS